MSGSPGGSLSSPAVREVLLVDDDAADAALITDAFEVRQAPVRLHHVVDGGQALAFLRRQPPYADAVRPDLILLDLNMPRVDGRQVLAEVKTDEQLKTIPVVVFTTSADATDIGASYAAHANAYVTKPLDLDDFDGSSLRFTTSTAAPSPCPARRRADMR